MIAEQDGHSQTGDKMVDYTIQIVIPIFELVFPGCEALFAFDNASNHCAFAADALIASRMNRTPGGQQPLLRSGWTGDSSNPQWQAMVFLENHPEPQLRGKAKGVEQVLRERGLWRDRRSDGFAFTLQCPVGDGRTGCDAEV